MLTYLQAIILGLFQGVTELFPVSSLGHSVILPHLLGWNIDQNADFFLVFLVFTHLATSLVLLGFFFSDWVKIIKGIFRSLAERAIHTHDTYAKLGWLIIVTSIPAGILGLLFEKKLKVLFASPRTVAVFLILNGILLYGAEILRKRSIVSPLAFTAPELSATEDSDLSSEKNISKLSWTNGLKVGFAQALALIPGFSRTGTTLGGGLLVRLNHEDAARFSFLLATPIIMAASLLKLPELLNANATYPTGQIIVGSIASAIAAYISVKFLTTYFKTKTLTPFALYCVIIGAGASILFFLY